MAKQASKKKTEPDSLESKDHNVIPYEEFFGLKPGERLKPGDWVINGKIVSTAEIEKQEEEQKRFREFQRGMNRLTYYQNEMKREFTLAHSSAECLVQLEGLLVQAGLQELAFYPTFEGINLRDDFELFLNHWRAFYQKALGITPMTKAELPLVFESVWVGQDEEYHKQLHEWLLNGWCQYDNEKKRFIWLSIPLDFGFVVSKIDQWLRPKPRWELLAEEWLFLNPKKQKEAPRPRKARQIRNYYNKHMSPSTPSKYTKALESLPVL